MTGLRLLSVLLGGLLFLTACPQPHPVPGDELLGTFAFTATVQSQDGGCRLGDFTSPQTQELQFLGTVSRCAADSALPLCAAQPGRAFFTYLDSDFDAGFDGQYVEVHPRSVRRTFAECGNDPTRMEERIHFALLSASQQQALGTSFDCGPNLLDGGVPAPDGGVVAPSFGPNGFDAVQACGVMVETVINDAFTGDGGAGTCAPGDAGVFLPTGTCTVVYTLRGDRR